MAGLDWRHWHKGYDDPDSSLSQRLRVVRRWTAEAGFTEVAFDGAPAQYGVGLYRWDRPTSTAALPARLFTFCR